MTPVPKKVLYVFGGEQASGAEIVMERLLSHNLATVEPHIFIAPGKFAQALVASNKPYKVTQVEALRKLNRSSASTLQFYKKAILNHFSVSYSVLKYTQDNKIDIVHAVTVVPASYCIPAIIKSKLLRKRIFWVWSDYDIKHFARIDHYFSALCSRVFNLTLAASKAVKRKYPLRTSVEVLYNGLDTEIFEPDKQARQAFRKQFGVEDQTVLFGIAGVVSPRKGQLELLKACSKAARLNKVQLIIAGSLGPDDAEYNQQVKGLAEELPNAKYIGHFPGMPQFFNGCDVVVNNSTAALSEPLGTTIYEAMSCEAIVLGSNTGGTPEIIDDGTNGFLFAPDDEHALTSIIDYVVNNIEKLEPIRKAAREKVKQKFGYQTMIHRYNSMLGLATEPLNKNAALSNAH